MFLLVPAYLGCPDQRPLNGGCCFCCCYYYYYYAAFSVPFVGHKDDESYETGGLFLICCCIL